MTAVSPQGGGERGGTSLDSEPQAMKPSETDRPTKFCQREGARGEGVNGGEKTGWRGQKQRVRRGGGGTREAKSRFGRSRADKTLSQTARSRLWCSPSSLRPGAAPAASGPPFRSCDR